MVPYLLPLESLLQASTGEGCWVVIHCFMEHLRTVLQGVPVTHLLIPCLQPVNKSPSYIRCNITCRERPFQDRQSSWGRPKRTSIHSEMARLRKRTSPDGTHNTVEDLPPPVLGLHMTGGGPSVWWGAFGSTEIKTYLCGAGRMGWLRWKRCLLQA